MRPSNFSFKHLPNTSSVQNRKITLLLKLARSKGFLRFFFASFKDLSCSLLSLFPILYGNMAEYDGDSVIMGGSNQGSIELLLSPTANSHKAGSNPFSSQL